MCILFNLRVGLASLPLPQETVKYSETFEYQSAFRVGEKGRWLGGRKLQTLELSNAKLLWLIRNYQKLSLVEMI